MGKNTLPVLWRRPGCCWRCCQPPCCGQLNCRGWSAEAPPPTLGSAQELAFLLCGDTHTHTHTITHNMMITTGALLGEKINLVHTSQTVHACANTQHSLSQPLPNTHERVIRSDYQWSHAATTSKHKRTPTHTIWPKEKKAVNVSCLWQCKSLPYGLETTHELNNDLSI